jgi:prepilin-type N-terminal cleavage/methylation domain-containing protein
MALDTSPYRPEEEGYTLLETLVAMVIFGSVLLPLSGMIAAVLIDRGPRQLQNALAEARTELCAYASADLGTTPTVRMAKGLIIRKEVRRHGASTEMTVTVSSASDPGRVVLVMHRTFINPPPPEEPLGGSGARL